MILPDSIFCEKTHLEILSQHSEKTYKRKRLQSIDETVNELAKYLQKTKEPMDFHEISKTFDLPVVKMKYSRSVYVRPDRAKKCVSVLLKKYPAEFEMTTVEKTKKNGTPYRAPAVKVIGPEVTRGPKPNFQQGQSVKMIDCPDAEISPDRVWTIRTEPYLFEGKWRVLLTGWLGSVDTDHIKAADINAESGGISS